MGWICPHCATTATLQKVDVADGWGWAMIDTAVDHDGIAIQWKAVKCPNNACGKYTMDIATFFGNAKFHPASERRSGDVKPNMARPFGIAKVRIEPRVGLPLSAHVPVSVQQDYEEACLIKDLSPKASATLCRRALQGMIRDFWKVIKPTLHGVRRDKKSLRL